jgi:c-di-GMP-binding flagellar brake protein YcgR
MRILSPYLLENGIVLILVFSLSHDPEIITCQAKVVRCLPSIENPGSYEMGLSFVGIKEDDRRRVQSFVELARASLQ